MDDAIPAMPGGDTADLDRLLQSFYGAAFHSPWDRFRQHALHELCRWTGAHAAAWATRTATASSGRMAVWPRRAAISHESMAELRFAAGTRERQLRPLPPQWRSAGVAEDAWALAFEIAHRDTAMRSVICLVFSGAVDPDRAAIRRALGHLTQAATLALTQQIRKDDWLLAMGRPSRGTAALVDEDGGIYVASTGFHELIADEFGAVGRSRLPFALPRASDEEPTAFVIGSLHFRLSHEGSLCMLHARRPHPLDILSPREREIARALAAGKTFKSVARECEIAISTVANHASRIYKKLGIFRREELVGMMRRANTPRASAA